jgi:hypothetical protein
MASAQGALARQMEEGWSLCVRQLEAASPGRKHSPPTLKVIATFSACREERLKS